MFILLLKRVAKYLPWVRHSDRCLGTSMIGISNINVEMLRIFQKKTEASLGNKLISVLRYIRELEII